MQVADPNKPPLRFRKLRIAWSAFWGLICLLLIVLWVRSYSRLDDVSWGISNGPGYKVISLKGEVLVSRWKSMDGAVTLGWYHGTEAAGELPPLSEQAPSKVFIFDYGFSRGSWIVPSLLVVPLWFILGLIGACAAAPWIPWFKLRFSLRTLLIATTLVAMALGLLIWLHS